MIELRQPFIFNNYVQPACLPTKKIKPGSTCYTSGWGSTKATKIDEKVEKVSLPDKLQAVGLEILSSNECSLIIKDFIDTFAKSIVGPNQVFSWLV